MRLSIIIPSYNMEGKIDQCMESIFSSTADKSQYEVIVCDSSSDNSMEVFKKWIEKEHSLKVIHSKQRLRIGPARNIAVKQAAGDYILCMDVDDKLHGKDALEKALAGLDGKDLYACSYWSRRDKQAVSLAPKDKFQLASCPVACWTKICKRELYVPFPNYMPEDVLPHFLVVDKAQTFGSFSFPLVDYDNTPENKGAISRTFDWLEEHPTNLLELASTGILKKMGLNEEYVAGVIRNLADMWEFRDRIQSKEVRKACQRRLAREYQMFMSGIYVH